MAIKNRVGKNGKNDSADVKVVQAALNLSQCQKFRLPQNLKVDGEIGNKTISAIESFQKNIVGLISVDGRVDPNGKTISTLKKTVKKGLSEDALIAIMAKGNITTIRTYLLLLRNMLPKYQINTPLRTAHFLAQVGHESLSFVYTKELASGAAYEGNKKLGNTQKGDGIRFKGRGLIQLTGRSNYSRYSTYANLNLLQKGNESLIANSPNYALDVSLWYWKINHLNITSDNDNLKMVTFKVNGGYNGLADRQEYLDRAKFFLLK